MRKIITVLMMLVVLTGLASADRYFKRSFTQGNVQVLNRPSDDLTSEFTKELTVLEWAKLYTKLGKPEFQTITTDQGIMCCFYCTSKEGYFVRVTFLKEEIK